ncbi:hypothetical protein D9M72_482460 [compost metagenome]
MCHRSEDEALVGSDARHLAEPELRAIDALIARGKRIAAQRAVVGERPAVVRACERTRRPFFGHAHPVAAVRTAVVQKMDPAFAVTRHEDRLGPDRLHHVVVGLGHFAFMADVDPGAKPDLAQLFFEDRRVGVERAVYLVLSDQIAPRTGLGICAGNRNHRGTGTHVVTFTKSVSARRKSIAMRCCWIDNSPTGRSMSTRQNDQFGRHSPALAGPDQPL